MNTIINARVEPWLAGAILIAFAVAGYLMGGLHG
jgi:hypothetical protein